MVKHFIHGKFVPRGINTGPPSGGILSLRGLSAVPIPSFIPLGSVSNHERIRVGTCVPSAPQPGIRRTRCDTPCRLSAYPWPCPLWGCFSGV